MSEMSKYAKRVIALTSSLTNTVDATILWNQAGMLSGMLAVDADNITDKFTADESQEYADRKVTVCLKRMDIIRRLLKEYFTKLKEEGDEFDNTSAREAVIAFNVRCNSHPLKKMFMLNEAELFA